MKKSKYSEAQIAAALRQVEAGAPISEVTRSLGITEATYDHRRKTDGQMAVAEIRRLRQLEEENWKLKQLVADLTLDKVILQKVLAKKGLTPTRKRTLVREVLDHFPTGLRRACGLLQLPRASWYYRAHRRNDTGLRRRLRELAQARLRWLPRPRTASGFLSHSNGRLCVDDYVLGNSLRYIGQSTDQQRSPEAKGRCVAGSLQLAGRFDRID